MLASFSVRVSETRPTAGSLFPWCQPRSLRRPDGEDTVMCRWEGGFNPLLSLKRSQSEYGGGVGVLWRWECEGQVTENGSFSSPHPLTRITQNPPPPKGQRSVTLTPHPQAVFSSSICTAPILMQTSFVVISDGNHGKSETGDQTFIIVFHADDRNGRRKVPLQNLQAASAFGFHNVGTGSTGATGQLINNGDFTESESLVHIRRGCRKMPFKQPEEPRAVIDLIAFISVVLCPSIYIKCSAGGKIINLISNQLNLNTETVKATTRT